MGESTGPKQRTLDEVLTETQVDIILKKMLGSEANWHVTSSTVKPAADGMVGFLGDHVRVTLKVAAGDSSKTLQLFLKRLPTDIPDKCDFITEYNFFKKEALVCQIIEKLQDNKDGEPWCVKTLISSDSMVVMPDMRPLGFSNCSQKTLDLPHLLLTAASVARFHAATTNYENNRMLQNNKPWTFQQEYAEILLDHQFNIKDSTFIQTSAKVTAGVLQTFSEKYNNILNLESKIKKIFLRANECLREHENTMNVLLHKDLWNANILFRYENGEPVKALLIDFQCLSYGPPAIDLMVLLHCTTHRVFREQHQRAIILHYYSVFMDNLDERTRQKLTRLGYDEEDLLNWCEKMRVFAVIQAASYSPMIFMDPLTAERVFNDPETFKEVCHIDRTQPTLEHCRQNSTYRDRILEISEELIERYLGE